MKIYVASSWKNERQPAVVEALREAGHEVYDFKNPGEGRRGFSWSEVNPDPKPWDWYQVTGALMHPRAHEGFKNDMDALESCDVCVLVLPCGRSAHLELGWAAGAGKKAIVLQEGREEPELMYKMCNAIVRDIQALLLWLEVRKERGQ